MMMMMITATDSRTDSTDMISAFISIFTHDIDDEKHGESNPG